MLSAGGVVYRTASGSVEVVICRRKAPPFWGLPKGTPHPGETHEQTALREVGEETGLEVEVDRFIDSIEYWFVRPEDDVRCQKTVLFYLMRPTGGDLSRHDFEFDEVRWVTAEEALRTLEYRNEVRVLEKGLAMVAAGPVA